MSSPKSRARERRTALVAVSRHIEAWRPYTSRVGLAWSLAVRLERELARWLKANVPRIVEDELREGPLEDTPVSVEERRKNMLEMAEQRGDDPEKIQKLTRRLRYTR